MPIATKLTDTYIFNPEHDLALAYGSEGYTAPPLARQMRRDLQMLPAWYCGNGADILSQNVDEDAAWIDDINRVMNLHATPVAVNRLQRRNSRYSPWGGISTCANGCSMPAFRSPTCPLATLC